MSYKEIERKYSERFSINRKEIKKSKRYKILRCIDIGLGLSAIISIGSYHFLFKEIIIFVLAMLFSLAFLILYIIICYKKEKLISEKRSKQNERIEYLENELKEYENFDKTAEFLLEKVSEKQDSIFFCTEFKIISYVFTVLIIPSIFMIESIILSIYEDKFLILIFGFSIITLSLVIVAFVIMICSVFSDINYKKSVCKMWLKLDLEHIMYFKKKNNK